MKKFIMSYSCGKDSTLALYRMIKKGNTPAALLVTVNKEENRSWFHGIPESLIKEVSKSLNIPLILVETKGNNYEEKFTEALIKAKDRLGIDLCVFGDIDLEPHREWCTARCNEAGVEANFPFVGTPRLSGGPAWPRGDSCSCFTPLNGAGDGREQ